MRPYHNNSSSPDFLRPHRRRRRRASATSSSSSFFSLLLEGVVVVSLLILAATFLLGTVNFFLSNNSNNVTNEKPDDTSEEEISLERLSSFIDLATSYLVRVSHTEEQHPGDKAGKFTYIAYLDEDLPLDFAAIQQHEQNNQKYNLLRHAGSIYSLGLSYDRRPGNDPSVLAAMERSANYLKQTAILPLPDMSTPEAQEAFNAIDEDEARSQAGAIARRRDLSFIPNVLAVWEDSSGRAVAKLGGAGLTLIALVTLEQLITPHYGGGSSSSDLSYLRQIGEFIEYLQHEDGSFTCRYIPVVGGRDDSWVSLYYPGEAALGLIYLASMEEQTDSSVYRQRWITVATKALMYLEKLRRNQDLSEIEPDHWALLATQRLLPLLDKKSKEYRLVYDHAVRVVKAMLSGHSKYELKYVYKGCFTQDLRTCPTATRLEGLIAALSFVGPHEMFTSDKESRAELLRDRMNHDIRIGVSFLLDAQETDTNYNMHGAAPKCFPSEDKDAREVRIDYVQHAMSAVIAYEKLLTFENHPFLRHDIVGVNHRVLSVLLVLAVLVVRVGTQLSRSGKRHRKHARQLQ